MLIDRSVRLILRLGLFSAHPNRVEKNIGSPQQIKLKLRCKECSKTVQNAYRLMKRCVIYFHILLGCKLRDISPRGTYKVITLGVLRVEYSETAKMCCLFSLIQPSKGVFPNHGFKRNRLLRFKSLNTAPWVRTHLSFQFYCSPVSSGLLRFLIPWDKMNHGFTVTD